MRCIVAGLLVMVGVGCGTVTTDLKDHPFYEDVVGARFVLNVDCYYGHWYDASKKALILYPTSDPTYSFMKFSQLPADSSNIGKRVEGVVIKGIIPAGTEFDVVRAIEFTNMITRACEITAVFDVDGRKLRVELYDMLDRRPVPPPFEKKKYFQKLDAGDD